MLQRLAENREQGSPAKKSLIYSVIPAHECSVIPAHEYSVIPAHEPESILPHNRWIPGQARDDVRVTPDLIRGRDDVRVSPG